MTSNYTTMTRENKIIVRAREEEANSSINRLLWTRGDLNS